MSFFAGHIYNSFDLLKNLLVNICFMLDYIKYHLEVFSCIQYKAVKVITLFNALSDT